MGTGNRGALTAFALTAALLVAGCTVNVSTGTGETSPGSDGASSGAVEGGASGEAAASSAPQALAVPDGIVLVNADFTKPGRQSVTAATGSGQTLAGASVDIISDTDTNIGLVYSLDGGRTWKMSPSIEKPGSQYGRGIMIAEEGIAVVGYTSKKDKNDHYKYTAFAARATAPDYVLEEYQLPSQFDGNIMLAGMVEYDGKLIIAGEERIPEKSTDSTNSIPTLWTSQDQGETWVKNPIKVKGSEDTGVDEFLIGPDGSMNFFGQSYRPDNGNSQFGASWLRSTDGGKTFTLQHQDVLDTAYDQGAYEAAFSPKGKVLISGWDELTENSDEDVSALWTDAGGAFTRVGGKTVPVEGANPKGDFIDGVTFNNETPVVWGNSAGQYPYKEVNFWNLEGSALVPSYTLSGEGGILYVADIIQAGNLVFAFGNSGPDKDNTDVTVWYGILK